MGTTVGLGTRRIQGNLAMIVLMSSCHVGSWSSQPGCGSHLATLGYGESSTYSSSFLLIAQAILFSFVISRGRKWMTWRQESVGASGPGTSHWRYEQGQHWPLCLPRPRSVRGLSERCNEGEGQGQGQGQTPLSLGLGPRLSYCQETARSLVSLLDSTTVAVGRGMSLVHGFLPDDCRCPSRVDPHLYTVETKRLHCIPCSCLPLKGKARNRSSLGKDCPRLP